MAKGVSRSSFVVEVDLHGLLRHTAEERMRKFMAGEIKAGTRSVRVIHGHGRGVMKEVVEEWIKAHANSVEDHVYEDGCILIYLKPKR